MTLQPEERVLLIISDCTIAGATRLQKYGFLLRKQFGKELSKIEDRYGISFYTDWKAHHYGPYSEQLSRDIKTCVDRRLVEEQNAKGPTGNRYMRYGFTTKGRRVWRTILGNNTKEVSDISDKVRFLQATNTGKLLRDIYTEYPAYAVNSKIKKDVLSD